MRVSIIIATYGEPIWEQQAREVAWPSAKTQQAEVIFSHVRDGTLTSVRNQCALAATGEWLCFLDADDELAPDYIAMMRRAAPHSAATLLVPAVQYVYPDRESTPEIPNGGGTRSLLDINHIAIGALVSRALFLKVGGFHERWECLEDYELWCRCVENGAKIAHVPDAVYRAHITPGRVPRYTTQQSFREHRLIRQQYRDVAALRTPVAA